MLKESAFVLASLASNQAMIAPAAQQQIRVQTSRSTGQSGSIVETRHTPASAPSASQGGSLCEERRERMRQLAFVFMEMFRTSRADQSEACNWRVTQ